MKLKVISKSAWFNIQKSLLSATWAQWLNHLFFAPAYLVQGVGGGVRACPRVHWARGRVHPGLTGQKHTHTHTPCAPKLFNCFHASHTHTALSDATSFTDDSSRVGSAAGSCSLVSLLSPTWWWKHEIFSCDYYYNPKFDNNEKRPHMSHDLTVNCIDQATHQVHFTHSHS